MTAAPLGRDERSRIALAVAALLVLGNAFAAIFVLHEHTLYSFDAVGYWARFDFVGRGFLHAPLATAGAVLTTIHREIDYNDLPTLLLAPAGMVFGTSRLAYVLSIVNLYAIPAFAVFLVVQQKIARSLGVVTRFAPWIAGLTLALLPGFWEPIVSGLPDIGGVAIGMIVVWLLLGRPFAEQSPTRLVAMAILVAFMILFRRWYAYWGVAFFASLFLVEVGSLIARRRWTLAAFLRIALTIGAQGAIALGVLALAAPAFLRSALTTNYADIYSNYRTTTSLYGAIWWLEAQLGGLFSVLSLAGAIVGLVSRGSRKIVAFLTLQLVLIFVLFTHTQDFAPNHLYLLIPSLALLASVALTRMMSAVTAPRIAGAVSVGLLFGWNCAHSFQTALPRSAWAAPLLSANAYLPEVRDDIPEIERMLSVLEHLVGPDDRIYVLASSPTFNCQLLQYAFLTLHDHEAMGERVLWTNDTDKRDGFPWRLLTVRFVAVGEPLQTSPQPENSHVLTLPAQLVLDGKGIGAAFKKLPHQFKLRGGVRVSLYERQRDFTADELAAFSDALRQVYPDRPTIYSDPRAISR